MANGKGLIKFKFNFPKTKEELFKSVAAAKEWFRERLRRLVRGQSDPDTEHQEAIRSYNDMTSHVKNPLGRLSYFIYKAEYDKHLPYWDRTPLTIMYNEDKLHMYGMNLHYVHPKIRALILESLLEKLMDANKPEAYLDISYSIMQSLVTIKYIKPCLKTYLKKNMQSKPIILRPETWQKAIMLPTATWERGSDRKVWTSSAKMYR